MSDWISLLKSLVWPTFLGILLFLTRRHVIAIVKSISARVERGDPFQAGPSGISLGPSDRKITRLDEEPKKVNETLPDFPVEYKNVVYLIHHATGISLGSDGIERRGIEVVLDADSDDILDKVECVVYHLHPTFPNPDRKVSDRQNRFRLKTSAWGEFNLSADVYFVNYKEPLTLYRYINFPWLT